MVYVHSVVCGFTIESVYTAGVYNASYLTLAIAGATMYFERMKFSFACHIIDCGLANTELLGNYFFCEWPVFLCLHKKRQ